MEYDGTQNLGLELGSTDGNTLSVDTTTAGPNNIAATSGGDLALGQIAMSTTIGTIGLTAAGAITGGGSANPITAAALAISDTNGFGTALTPFFTNLGTLAANVGSGGVFVENTGNLTVGSVDGVNGVTVAGGPVDITSSGNLIVSKPITASNRIPPVNGDDISLTGNGVIQIPAPLTGSTAAVTGGAGNDTFTIGTDITTPLIFKGLGGSNAFIFRPPAASRCLLHREVPYPLEQDPVQYSNFGTIELNDAGSISTFYGPNTADRSTALEGLTTEERFVQVLCSWAFGASGNRLPNWSSGSASKMQAILRGVSRIGIGAARLACATIW